MNRTAVIALGAALLLVSAAAAAETYRWVDAEGNVHYGDRPAQGSQEVTIRVPGVAPEPPPATDGVASEPPATTTEPDADAQVRSQLCTQARERLASYENSDGIFEESPDGKRRELTLDERVDTILKARQSVKDSCGPEPS